MLGSAIFFTMYKEMWLEIKESIVMILKEGEHNSAGRYIILRDFKHLGKYGGLDKCPYGTFITFYETFSLFIIRNGELSK